MTNVNLEQFTLAIYSEAIKETTRLQSLNSELRIALQDAEFLMRNVSINWKEAGAMKDSMARSAEDARKILKKAAQ